MANKNKSTTTAIPKFTIDRPSGKKEACAKVSLPLMAINTAGATLAELIKQAMAETGATSVRGTLTLYKQ